MITSIVLTGKHHIAVNSNKKIKVNENVLSIEKDIPFIRYRFDSYTDDDFNYIKEMMNKFNCSTHLVEVKLSESSKSILEYLENNIPNVAKYIYIDVTDEEVANKKLNDNIMELLNNTLDYTVDRYMLKDKSTTLDTVAAKSIIKSCCSAMALSDNVFGVCSSPLSFSDWACLTAVKARELMSLYSTIADVALPTANHQCMNCCGCIRYMVVDSDTEEVTDGKQKAKAKKEKTDADTPKETNSKPKSKSKIPMFYGEFNL